MSPLSAIKFTAAALSLAAAAEFSSQASQAIQARGGERYFQAEGGFRNTDDPEGRGFLDFLRWQWERLWKDIPGPDAYDFPLAGSDPGFVRANRTKTTATWIGHATVLVQTRGINILTDPHFSERASPVQWAGPRRVVPPGIPLDELPPIDFVLISHDHYDSLDEGSVLGLYRREEGDETTFLVPTGLGRWFENLGVTRVVELGWWERHEERGLVITAVPVRHWSKRTFFGRNETLWAGWVVQAEDFRFFFAGDSGYSPVFREIGKRLGPFDLSALPIGAYKPEWFMRKYHLSPEDAVSVHVDVGSKKSIAIHWGTFILTDERLDEPPVRLLDSLRERGIPEEEFAVLRHGETLVLD